MAQLGGIPSIPFETNVPAAASGILGEASSRQDVQPYTSIMDDPETDSDDDDTGASRVPTANSDSDSNLALPTNSSPTVGSTSTGATERSPRTSSAGVTSIPSSASLSVRSTSTGATERSPRASSAGVTSIPSSASLSSTTSAAGALSTTASTGLGTSAKVGIGLGVPLSVVSLAVLIFLVLRHLRHKKASRLKHHGIVAARGLYPVVDEPEKDANLERIEPQVHDNLSSGVQEIHGKEVPSDPRELIGSSGVPRRELPTTSSSQ